MRLGVTQVIVSVGREHVPRAAGDTASGSYTSGAPAVVVGPGVGVAVRDGFPLPFRLTGWDCSTYSNFRESRVNVTGP